jgi:translation initiation factor 2B subunit (eIF-2B alpha/beta/delta family)
MDTILKTYATKSKDSAALVSRIERLVAKYGKTGINKENLPGLVSVLMVDVQKIKGLTGADKKDLVIDLINSVIEQIDAGDEDTELETVLKTMVPPMIDSFSVMLKVNKACGCM